MLRWRSVVYLPVSPSLHCWECLRDWWLNLPQNFRIWKFSKSQCSRLIDYEREDIINKAKRICVDTGRNFSSITCPCSYTHASHTPVRRWHWWSGLVFPGGEINEFNCSREITFRSLCLVALFQYTRGLWKVCVCVCVYKKQRKLQGMVTVNWEKDAAATGNTQHYWFGVMSTLVPSNVSC